MNSLAHGGGLPYVRAQRGPRLGREMQKSLRFTQECLQGSCEEGLWVEYQWHLLHHASPFSIAQGLGEFQRE